MLRRSAGHDPCHEGTPDVLQIEHLGKVRVDVLNADAKPSTRNGALVDQVLHDAPRHVDRHGKADPLVTPAAREDRRIHPHNLATQAHQWSSAVAGVDRRIGLDEVLIFGDAYPGTSLCTDNPESDSL